MVRLVQVSYPDMVDQLIPIQAPCELAGRVVKEKYSQELGIDRDEIAVVYITPCQAKTVSIRAPAEGGRSNLDGALGISDVYNDIMALMGSPKKNAGGPSMPFFSCGAEMLRWGLPETQGRVLSRHRYMSVTGLANIIQVFDDIEKGKLRNIEYLECYACWNGCANGNLTVDNVYVTLSRLYNLLTNLPDSDPELEAEIERRYLQEDFSLEAPVRPRACLNASCSRTHVCERCEAPN